MFTAANKEGMDHAQTKGHHAAEEAKKGAFRVKRDVSNDLSDAAESIRDDLQDMARYAGRQVREFAGDAEGALTTRVREKPVQSILIAAAAGFVASLLIRR